MKQEISGFLAYIGTERGLSPKTVEAYSYDLAKFSEFADKELDEGWSWEDVDQYAIKAYMQFLADTGYKKGNSAVSRGRKLATIKSFFKYLISEAKVKFDPATQVKMPKIKQKEPSYLTERDMVAMRNVAVLTYNDGRRGTNTDADDGGVVQLGKHGPGAFSERTVFS